VPLLLLQLLDPFLQHLDGAHEPFPSRLLGDIHEPADVLVSPLLQLP
jgi:hypothetical protein